MGPGDAAMGIGPRLLLGLFRTFVAPNLGVVGRDLAVMEHELAASGLDWYAVRPAKLTDGPLTKRVHAERAFRDDGDLPGRRSVVYAEPRRRPETSTPDSNARFCRGTREQRVPPSGD